MDASEKFEYWREIAEYDLETADAMLLGGRYVYVVFMCQQAIEKLAKGLYTFFVDDNPPRTHNIVLLVGRFRDNLTQAIPEEYISLFTDLTKYYLNNRYPDFVSNLNTLVGRAEAGQVLGKTKEVFAWLLTMKP